MPCKISKVIYLKTELFVALFDIFFKCRNVNMQKNIHIKHLTFKHLIFSSSFFGLRVRFPSVPPDTTVYMYTAKLSQLIVIKYVQKCPNNFMSLTLMILTRRHKTRNQFCKSSPPGGFGKCWVYIGAIKMSLIQIIGSKLFFKCGDILPLFGVFSKLGVAREGGGNFVDRFLKFTICTHLVSKRARKLLDFKLIFF